LLLPLFGTRPTHLVVFYSASKSCTCILITKHLASNRGALSAVDREFESRSVKQTTLKFVFVASPLSTQHLSWQEQGNFQ
jgi:hypothetical protein